MYVAMPGVQVVIRRFYSQCLATKLHRYLQSLSDKVAIGEVVFRRVKIYGMYLAKTIHVHCVFWFVWNCGLIDKRNWLHESRQLTWANPGANQKSCVFCCYFLETSKAEKVTLFWGGCLAGKLVEV